MKTKFTALATGLFALVACGDNGARNQPILDGAPTPAYDADLAECRSLAENQFSQDTLGATMLGAGLGAALGEADGADALGGAVAGALAGGVASAVDVNERRDSIVIECLRGRGHRVVG